MVVVSPSRERFSLFS